MHRLVNLALLTGLIACSGSDPVPAAQVPPAAPPPPPPTNAAPTANAGAAQTGIEGQTIILDAGASADADGTITEFSWQQISGPAITLEAANTASPVFEIPLLANGADFSFELTVTDDDGATDTDTVEISGNLAPRGTVVEIVREFGGFDRTFSVYTPAGFIDNAPAVLLLHGGSGSMREIISDGRTTQGWLDFADQEGFLLIIPNGFNETNQDGLGDEQSWNDIRDDQTGRTSLQDDQGFLLSVLDSIEATRGHDGNRVFVTGSSNGGIMSFTMMIEQSDRVFGAAAFIAALPEEMVIDPPVTHPIMMLNGSDDALILFDGGPVGNGGAPTRSVPDTVDYWVRNSGANGPMNRPLPDLDPADGCTIEEDVFSSPTTGEPAVIFYTANGGGHNVPDPDAAPFPPAAIPTLGNRCRDANGVTLAFEFFLSLL